jgi:hypothetical protein
MPPKETATNYRPRGIRKFLLENDVSDLSSSNEGSDADDSEETKRAISRTKTKIIYCEEWAESVLSTDAFVPVQTLSVGAFCTIDLAYHKSAPDDMIVVKRYSRAKLIEKNIYDKAEFEAVVREHKNHPYIVTL